MPDPVVVLGAARTPLGSFQGELMPLTAPELGARAIAAALERCGAAPDDVAEATMGCVLPAGLGQAPARQAAVGAGLPKSVPCTTVNKMCGSGMMALMIAHDGLLVRPDGLHIAGGMESMSNAPYLLPKVRGGLRLGHDRVIDHMFLDGLEDAYETGRLMGSFAEDAAEAYQLSREAQDAYAAASLLRALAAAEGPATEEIVPVETQTRKGMVVVSRDEQPRKADPAKIAMLRPAFREGGTVTAANSSSISDGAAALVLSRQSFAEARGHTPLARIVATSRFAGEPSRFTSAPVEAIRRVLDASGWKLGDVDLFEVNEAFAVVPMIAMQDLGIPHDVMNVHGGACALGHPIGASGARVLVTLIAALRQRGARRGIAAICIGGGEATAIALETLD